MHNYYLDYSISELSLDNDILERLTKNNINFIKDLWKLKRSDLKSIKFNDIQINQIIIKMQLFGIDLNKKKYDKN